VPSSRVTTCFGPTAPRCSHIEAEPGPPLKTKQTGRVFASASSRKYDVVKTAASGSPRFSSMPPAVTGTNAAIALYFIVLPLSLIVDALLLGSVASRASSFRRSFFFALLVMGAGLGSLMGMKSGKE
jgi:hypothetical protein